MKKTVRKLDNNVIKALTIACESFKDKVDGFEWLTHSADYSNFPASLVVTCVFDMNKSVDVMLQSELDIALRKQVQKQLLKAGILLKDVRRHVFFDTEEACLLEHNGDWKRRLAIN